MILILGIPLIFVNLFLVKEACFNLTCKEGFDPSGNIRDMSGNTHDMSGNLQDISSNLHTVQNNVQSRQNARSTESFGDNSNSKNNNTKNKPQIDYASTVEEAYDNLNSILGSEGIQNLTKDT